MAGREKARARTRLADLRPMPGQLQQPFQGGGEFLALLQDGADRQDVPGLGAVKTHRVDQAADLRFGDSRAIFSGVAAAAKSLAAAFSVTGSWVRALSSTEMRMRNGVERMLASKAKTGGDRGAMNFWIAARSRSGLVSAGDFFAVEDDLMADRDRRSEGGPDAAVFFLGKGDGLAQRLGVESRRR